MWQQASIILEIIAGMLLAIHFVLRRKSHTKIDNWLLTRLQRKIVPRGRLRPGAVVIAGIPTLMILIGIVVWGFIKDLQGKTWQTGELIASYAILVAAIIAAVLTISFIVWILNKYLRNKSEPIYIVLVLSFIIGVACILIVPLTSTYLIQLTSFLLTFAVTIMIMGIWLGVMPFAQKYFTIRSGVLVRFGLALFIVAKIIQLKLAS